MDWNQIYIEKHKERKGWSFRYTINFRIRRFKSNPPTKPEHFSELEYLIMNYDYQKALFRRYGYLISDDAKNKWLEKKINDEVYPNVASNNIYGIMLPFYLISPNTNNPKIDKYFLHDQLLLALGTIDHKFKKYRERAKSLFRFLIPNFMELNPNLRKSIVQVLTVRTTMENIHNIKCLIIKNWKFISEELLNQFFEEQFQRKLITPKMAIGIFRRREDLNKENINNLMELILMLDKGEYILNKLNHG